jgi:hypothetical protein
VNEAQHRASIKVAEARNCVHRLASDLSEAERRLKRAEARLRREIRLDPDAYAQITAVSG